MSAVPTSALRDWETSIRICRQFCRGAGQDSMG